MGSVQWDGKQFGGRVSRELHDALDEAGRLIADRAREKAPRDSGELANSIHHEVNGSFVRVIATAPHAINVEFDTDDTRAQPFLRPALFESEDEVIRKLQRALE